MTEQIDTINQILTLTAKRVSRRHLMRKRFALLLERNARLCAAVPEIIKVAGTNGKGSLCAMLTTALQNRGLKSGRFTSPHLFHVSERFQIDGEPVAPDILDKAALKVKEEIEAFVGEKGDDYMPSFFEALILIALNLFADAGAAVAVMEAGIGGYNDAVALLPGRVSVITSIGLDHREQLGGTLASVAADKAGIASDNGVLVLGPDIDTDALQAIETDAKKRNVKVVRAQMTDMVVREMNLRGTSVQLISTGECIHIPLPGEFQVKNLAVLRTLLKVRDADAPKPLNLTGTSWPARLETVPGTPTWLLDAAHNPHAFAALSQSLEKLLHKNDCILLYGAATGKEYHQCLPYLSAIATDIYITDDFYRSQPAEDIARECPPGLRVRGTFHSIPEAVTAICKTNQNANKTIIAAGSIFMVGRVREHLKTINQQESPGAPDMEQIYHQLSQLPKMGNGIGLHRMERLCAHITAQSWWKQLDTLRVTGSNGKGSVCLMAAAILKELGISHGIYTSPHLLHYNERFSLNGNPISNSRLQSVFQRFREKWNAYADTFPDDAVGTFEALTCMAVEFFNEMKPETVIAEAGIGGRYDSTRIFPGTVVGLTALDLEHTELLGATLEQIAYDKADLCPEGGTLVVGRVEADVFRRLSAYCRLKKIRLLSSSEAVTLDLQRMDENGQTVDFGIGSLFIPGVRLSCFGTVQRNNAATALLMVREWLQKNRPDVGDREFSQAVREGFSRLRLPGRFHRIAESPDIYVDTAHTPDAAAHLAETVKQVLGNRSILLVTGVSHDKKREQILQRLLPMADAVICTQAAHKGSPATEIATTVKQEAPELPCYTAQTMIQAIHKARALATEKQMTIVVAGGLFLAAEAMIAIRDTGTPD